MNSFKRLLRPKGLSISEVRSPSASYTRSLCSMSSGSEGNGDKTSTHSFLADKELKDEDASMTGVDVKTLDPKTFVRMKNYSQFDYLKKKEKVEFKRKVFKTQEFWMREKVRAGRMKQVSMEAEAAGKKMTLKVACVIERLPVILPDLKPWEVDYLALKETRAVFKKKRYPTGNLRMNVQTMHGESLENKSGLIEQPLPNDVEPWVYELLSRDTKQLGPFMNIPNLEQRLLSLTDTVQGENDHTDPAALGSLSTASELDAEGKSESDDGEDFTFSNEEGWFEDEEEIARNAKSNRTSDFDDFALEIDFSQGGELSSKEFEPASRVTIDDEEDNRGSLNRALSERLYLMVKVKDEIDGTVKWQFPEFDYDRIVEEFEEKSEGHKAQWLSKVAETGMKQLTDYDCELFFVGNAPAGFVNLKYGNEGKEKHYGKSVFFYRAQLLEDFYAETSFDFETLIQKENILEYAWITKSQLSEYTSNDQPGNEAYWELAEFLLED